MKERNNSSLAAQGLFRLSAFRHVIINHQDFAGRQPGYVIFPPAGHPFIGVKSNRQVFRLPVLPDTLKGPEQPELFHAGERLRKWFFR